MECCKTLLLSLFRRYQGMNMIQITWQISLINEGFQDYLQLIFGKDRQPTAQLVVVCNPLMLLYLFRLLICVNVAVMAFFSKKSPVLAYFGCFQATFGQLLINTGSQLSKSVVISQPLMMPMNLIPVCAVELGYHSRNHFFRQKSLILDLFLGLVGFFLQHMDL